MYHIIFIVPEASLTVAPHAKGNDQIMCAFLMIVSQAYVSL